jgi:hypothetical protein
MPGAGGAGKGPDSHHRAGTLEGVGGSSRFVPQIRVPGTRTILRGIPFRSVGSGSR